MSLPPITEPEEIWLFQQLREEVANARTARCALDSYQWRVGDLLIYNLGHEGKYTDSHGVPNLKYGYRDIAQETGIPAGQLRDFVWVAHRVPLSVRTDKLSWNHHRQVAKLSPEKQREWLNRASSEDYSVHALRKAIKTEFPPEAAPHDPQAVETKARLEKLFPEGTVTMLGKETKHHHGDYKDGYVFQAFVTPERGEILVEVFMAVRDKEDVKKLVDEIRRKYLIGGSTTAKYASEIENEGSGSK